MTQLIQNKVGHTYSKLREGIARIHSSSRLPDYERSTMKILTAAEMKDVDRLTTERYHVPSLTLMENAGASVAKFMQERFPDLARRKILILCGKGNNGGDGFVVARHLLKMGTKPLVHLFADTRELKGNAAANLKRWKKTSGKLHVDREADRGRMVPLPSDYIVVDALLGTGARGRIEGRLREVIASINQRELGSCVVSIDIPSGLHADSGEVQGAAVVSDFTVTFTAPKPGLFLGAGSRHVGQLFVRDIGTPPALIEEIGKGKLHWSEPHEFSQFAHRRKPDGNKGDYGHALIVAGSVGKSGAAVLASWAALRAGAGLVTVATPEPVLPIVAAHTPEIMTEPLSATTAGTVSERCLEGSLMATLLKGKRALGIGPGLSTNDETQRFIRDVVGKRSVPIILDADGLNAFTGRAAELENTEGMICVTPHPGEMARLAGCKTEEIQNQRVELALKSAADWNACVVLKGHHTVIASPDGHAWINSTGNPGMGTAGTGDVLTGILSGLTAQYGVDSWPQVIAFGVYVHGLAGDIAYADTGEAPLIASDLIRAIPCAYQRFYSESGRG
jgi:ADP-dependent NAD(P)H-hydrate dehydratase / NAD(P)H-hydrate epimerase